VFRTTVIGPTLPAPRLPPSDPTNALPTRSPAGVVIVILYPAAVLGRRLEKLYTPLVLVVVVNFTGSPR
jgi:hypothetical protein